MKNLEESISVSGLEMPLVWTTSNIMVPALVASASLRGLRVQRIPPQVLPSEDQTDNTDKEKCSLTNIQYGKEEELENSPKFFLWLQPRFCKYILENIHLQK